MTKNLIIAAAMLVVAVALFFGVMRTSEEIDPARPTATEPNPSTAPTVPQTPATPGDSVPR